MHSAFTVTPTLSPQANTTLTQVWEDVHQYIRFVDVTEECRRLYGLVQSNCSLIEVGKLYTYYT